MAEGKDDSRTASVMLAVEGAVAIALDEVDLQVIKSFHVSGMGCDV